METDNSTINEIGSRDKEGTPNSIYPIEFRILFSRLNSQFYSAGWIYNSIHPIEFTFYSTDWIHISTQPIEFTILSTR